MGHFHLVDGHAIGIERERLFDRVAPGRLRVAHHAGDQVNVDPVESDLAGPFVRTEDFGRPVGPSASLQDVVVEVLDAQAQARRAQGLDRFELALLQRARLTLEGHFPSVVPRPMLINRSDQTLELRAAEKRRRASSEVNEFERSAGQRGSIGIQRRLAHQGFKIGSHVTGVLVGVNPIIAELAARAAEWDMQVEA